MRHEARQVPSWLIFDVRQDSRLTICDACDGGRVSRCTAESRKPFDGCFSARKSGPAARTTSLGELGLAGLRRHSNSPCRFGYPVSALDLAISEFWSFPRFTSIGFRARFPHSNEAAFFPRTQKPNKAPEPTPTAVMPRAILGESEGSRRKETRNPARVMPAAVVAHL